MLAGARARDVHSCFAMCRRLRSSRLLFFHLPLRYCQILVSLPQPAKNLKVLLIYFAGKHFKSIILAR